MLIILHRGPSYSCEYSGWIEGYSGRSVLVVSAEANKPEYCSAAHIPNVEQYSDVIFLKSYDTRAALDDTIARLRANGEVAHVVAPFEFDLVRASELRQVLGLVGQQPDSALVFRDKLLMKTAARDAGLLSYQFAPVACWDEVARHHKAWGGAPVVLKPRSGAASRGVLRVDDPSAQRDEIEWLFDNPLFISPDFMVEEFVAGDVYHIDGLVLDGSVRLVWPSQYITGSLEFQSRVGHTISSAMLDRDSDLTHRLQDYARALLRTLPTPTNCTFHCEVFVTPDGRIELCEIASRTGGVRIKHALDHAFGVDIAEACVRADLGLPQRFCGTVEHPGTLTGWATMAGRNGKIDAIPENCKVPGVYGYQKIASVGDTIKSPKSAVDYIANCDIEGVNFSAIVSSIEAARSWFYSELIVS